MAPSRPRPVDDSHSRSDRDASSLPTTKAHHDRHSILGPTSHSSVQKSGTGRSSRPGQNGNSSAAATAAGSASASNSRQTGAGGNGNGNGAGATSTSMDGAIEEKELPKVRLTRATIRAISSVSSLLFTIRSPYPPLSSRPYLRTSLPSSISQTSPASPFHCKSHSNFIATDTLVHPPHPPPPPLPPQPRPISPPVALPPPRLRLPRPGLWPVVSLIYLLLSQTEDTVGNTSYEEILGKATAASEWEWCGCWCGGK